MASTEPYIGSTISLISKAEIRYEGTLYGIDPTESTVTLSRVHSYGTENRPVSKFIPPRSEVFEYIVFKGSDIKDLTVHPRESQTQEQPQPEADPAIVSSTPVGMPPLQPGAPPPRGPMYPPHMPPGPYGPYPGMPFYGPPPPMGMYPHPPPMGLPPGARIQGPPMQPPNMADGRPPGPQMGPHSSHRMVRPPPPPVPAPAQVPPPVDEVPPPQSPSPPSDTDSGPVAETTAPQNSHQAPEGLTSKTPAQEAEEGKGTSKVPPKGHPVSATVQPRVADSGQTGSREPPRPLAPETHPPQPVVHLPPTEQGGRQPVDRGGHQRRQGDGRWYQGEGQDRGRGRPHQQRGTGQSRQGHQGPSGGGHQQPSGSGYQRRPNPAGQGRSIKFEGEFDFESANAKFHKEGLEDQLKEKLSIGEEGHGELEEGEIPEGGPVTPVYDKTISFFDNISTESHNPESKSYSRSEERATNTETFGVSGVRRGSGFRGRGRGGRRRGRGGRGGREGRGGYQQQQAGRGRVPASKQPSQSKVETVDS